MTSTMVAKKPYESDVVLSDFFSYIYRFFQSHYTCIRNHEKTINGELGICILDNGKTYTIHEDEKDIALRSIDLRNCQESIAVMHDDLNAKYNHAFCQLEYISHLEQDWNENGAQAFSKDLIEKCRRILFELSAEPSIFPTACNSIQFEYEKDSGEYLEFEIYSDHIKFFYIDSSGKENTGIFDLTSQIQQIKKMVIDFYG